MLRGFIIVLVFEIFDLQNDSGLPPGGPGNSFFILLHKFINKQRSVLWSTSFAVSATESKCITLIGSFLKTKSQKSTYYCVEFHVGTR